jgi:hypothetical protein
MTATAAHIHEAAAGANGPVIVPFTKPATPRSQRPPARNSPKPSTRRTRRATSTSTCTAPRIRAAKFARS